MSSKSLSKFIKHIEEHIFKKELIYRTIIVMKDIDSCFSIKNKLEKNDYSVLLIDEVSNINYNVIYQRIVIIPCDLFEKFILYLDEHNNGILNSSYNFIAFDYDLDNIIENNLLSFYIKMTKNNSNNDIILDKKYSELIMLENELN